MATVAYDGDVKAHNLFRPWGTKLSSMVSSGRENQFQYTGQILDEDLDHELAYYGARYYDPQLRIFTSVDPAWKQDPAFGPYVYTRNNPVKYVDPSGGGPILAALIVWGGAVAASPETPMDVQIVPFQPKPDRLDL